MKQIWGWIAVHCLLITGTAHADWNAVPCFAGEKGAHGPSMDDGACWYWDASLLYLKTGGDELDYGVVRYEYDSGVASSSFKQRYHDIKMDWDFGFRLGAGCPLPCLDWGLDLSWTHYENASNSDSHDNADSAAAVTTYAIPYISGSELDIFSSQSGTGYFHGHYKVRYDTVDLECGRWFGRTNCAFGFRPHAGLRFANIHENLKSKVWTSLTTNPYYKSSVKNDFIGCGLRAGFDVSLAVYDGISLIGKAAGAIVWGRTKIDLHADQIYTSISSTESKEKYLQGRVMTDFVLGVNWSTMVCSWPIDFELDWEMHYLFGQHRFFTNNALADFGANYPTLQTKKNGDLTLQGISLKIAMDF